MKLIVQGGGTRLFLPPGKGKTGTVLKAFQILKNAGHVDALLVLGPLRVVTTSWPQELGKWSDFEGLSHVTIHGGKTARLKAMQTDADVYLMKSVIHDWNDERSRAILRACRAALRPGARLVLVEIVVPERPGTSPLDQMIAGTDLNMLVMTGGRERTEAQYRALCEAAGLRVTRILPTATAFSLIEAEPA